MKIKFTTTDKLALEYFPPVPAKKLIPDWYKELPLRNGELTAKELVSNDSSTTLTIKGCIPVMDYITHGYILRATSDILITPEQRMDEKTFWWKSKHSQVTAHPHGQCPVKIKGVKNDYMKIISDWKIETPKGYSCYFYQPEFFFEKNFKLFPAVVDTDSYLNLIHFPGVVLTDDSFTIEAGTPLMVVFPFKREDWVADISEEKTAPLSPFELYIERAYKKLFHKPKNFE